MRPRRELQKLFDLGVAAFIAKRIAFNQQKSFSRFIIRLSIIATVISVAVMIITLSFVNGFQETVSQKVFSFWGHARVAYRQPMKSSIAEEEPITKNDTLVQEVKSLPAVKSIFPFATKYAILKTPDEMEGVLLKGVDSNYDFSHLQNFLQPGGRWVQFNDSTYSREIVISTHTAKKLNLKVNDRVLIYFFRADGSVRPDKLTIVGLYKTGIQEYDNTFAISDMKLIQRLNSWEENEIGGYEIFLHDYKQMDAAVEDIRFRHNFPVTWEAQTARDLYPHIFDWLDVQDTNQNILIAIMIIIAVINLITCLIILVLERLRMIGILKALGASNWTVQKIFLQHSIIITAAGIILGTAFALALLFTQLKTGFLKLQEENYYMETAAVKIVWWQVAAVCGGTLLVSFLVLLIPSFIVRKVQPIKAIHFK